MSHYADAVHLLTGARYPRAAVALGGTYFWKDGREHPDTFHAILDYPEGFLNAGTVDGLPEGTIVEAPTVVTGSTFAPIPQGGLPDGVTGLVARVAEHARLTAEAAVTGDRELAVRALAVHPLVGSSALARALVEDYLSAHAEQLPRFAA